MTTNNPDAPALPLVPQAQEEKKDEENLARMDTPKVTSDDSRTASADVADPHVALSHWRMWVQFVWLGGGTPHGNDAELRARACAAHEKDVTDAKRDAIYHADCRPNRRQAEAWRDDAKALNDWRADVTVALGRPGGAHYIDVPKHIREMRAMLECAGYRYCDIPACNCGSWHQMKAASPAPDLRTVTAVGNTRGQHGSTAPDLRQWVRHKPMCLHSETAIEHSTGQPAPCTCGLDVALHAPKEPTS